MYKAEEQAAAGRRAAQEAEQAAKEAENAELERRRINALRIKKRIRRALVLSAAVILAVIWAVLSYYDIGVIRPEIFGRESQPDKPRMADAYITGDGVNVRTQPTTGSRAVDSLSRGAEVEVLKNVGEWRLVRRAGTRDPLGWVYGEYVSEIPPGPAGAEVQTDLADKADGTGGESPAAFVSIGSAEESSGPFDPPPVVISSGRCPFEGCQLGTWVATNTIPLRGEPGGPISEKVIYSGQRAQALESEVWATPRRGTVLEAVPYELRRGLQPGAEVYVLHPLGEGAMAVWYQGEIIESSADLRIDLQKELEWSWWVRVATEDGHNGWLKDPQGNFDGMTSY